MSGSPSRSIIKLLDVLKVAAKMEKAPGFSNYLGLSPDFYAKLSPDELSFERNTFHVRIPISERIYLPHRNAMSLSTYLAIIDETTTWAFVLADEDRGRAGVSVSLDAKCGPASRLPTDSVDVNATVTKVGRNMGFVQAEITDSKTQGLICHGSHIKYLPMGPLMDFMTSSRGANLTKWFADTFVDDPRPHDNRPLAALFESFHMESDTRATFVVAPEHASLGGPIHGGCQAILIELAATETLARLLPQLKSTMDSIHVEYLSSPSPKEAQLEVQVMPKTNESPLITVKVNLISKGRLSSVGMLQFVTTGDQPIGSARAKL
jgi:acyl-coenzyme A thioesterase PaaI-like protein